MVQAPTAPVKTSIRQEGGSLPYALRLVLLVIIAVILGKGKSFLKSPLGHMPTTEPIIDMHNQIPQAGLVNHDGPSGAGRASYSSSPGNIRMNTEMTWAPQSPRRKSGGAGGGKQSCLGELA